MNLQGHDVRIEQDNNNITRVFIDGRELKGAIDVNYNNGVGNTPVITVEFMPATLNLNKEAIVEVTTLGDNYRKFIKEEEGEV